MKKYLEADAELAVSWKAPQYFSDNSLRSLPNYAYYCIHVVFFLFLAMSFVVSSSDDIRLERLVLRGMDRDDAKKRMAMQMTREEYEELADRVLVNDGTIEELYEQIDRYVKEELNERGIRL